MPQLEGRANKPTLQAFLPDPFITADRGQCEWTVRAPRGTAVTLTARHERAGRAVATLTLADPALGLTPPPLSKC